MGDPATSQPPVPPTLPPPTGPQIEDLCERFAAATVPASEWTHRAHITVGTAYVHRWGAEEALIEMRRGLLQLNRAHGTPETPTRGYHETITRAYLVLIARLLAEQPQPPPGVSSLEACVAAVLASPLAARDVLLTYYTRERLMSPEARRDWLPPDLAPLEDRAPSQE